MTVRRILRWLIVATCCNPATILAQSQPGPIIDLAGEWAAQVHEDAIYRGAGGFLGDYTGLPINAASRQMAESWTRTPSLSRNVRRRRTRRNMQCAAKDRTYGSARSAIPSPINCSR